MTCKTKPIVNLYAINENIKSPGHNSSKYVPLVIILQRFMNNDNTGVKTMVNMLH